METRTSGRQAAQKAKEAIAAAPDTKRRGSIGTKRKGSTSTEKPPGPKREKKTAKEIPERPEKEKSPQVPGKVANGENQVEQTKEKPAESVQAKHEEQPQPTLEETPSEKQEQPRDGPDKQPEETPEEPEKTEDKSEKTEGKAEEKPSGGASGGTENALKTTQEREDIVPSNILEKGIIYFFYRGRVNVHGPHSIQDIARSFFVLRPTPLGASLDREQGAADTGAKCRLMMLPKKSYPRSGKDREMAFVEKAGISVKELQETFIAGDTYETSTRGTREVPEAKPYAEGVYAITSTKRATHLVYHITLPGKLSEIQQDFGLSERGSWLVQSRNPKFPSPPSAHLPKEPEYPESILQKFKDLRWIPTEPELLDYPNAQFLMVGSAVGDLGKAATAESGDKRPEEQQPEEELTKMEDENEARIEALGGDHAIYKDLGYHAKVKYSKPATTWE
ncbi:hypothetical protein BJX70DRAFT_248843 [Aspergillus crustosus]